MTGFMQLLDACMLAKHIALLPDVSARLRGIMDELPCWVLYVPLSVHCTGNAMECITKLMAFLGRYIYQQTCDASNECVGVMVYVLDANEGGLALHVADSLEFHQRLTTDNVQGKVIPNLQNTPW